MRAARAMRRPIATRATGALPRPTTGSPWNRRQHADGQSSTTRRRSPADATARPSSCPVPGSPGRERRRLPYVTYKRQRALALRSGAHLPPQMRLPEPLRPDDPCNLTKLGRLSALDLDGSVTLIGASTREHQKQRPTKSIKWLGHTVDCSRPEYLVADDYTQHLYMILGRAQRFQ